MEHLILRSVLCVLQRVSFLQPLQQVLILFGQPHIFRDVIVAPWRGEDFVLVLVDPLDEASVALDQVRLLTLLLRSSLVLAEVRQRRGPAAALQLPLTLRAARLREGAQRGGEEGETNQNSESHHNEVSDTRLQPLHLFKKLLSQN